MALYCSHPPTPPLRNNLWPHYHPQPSPGPLQHLPSTSAAVPSHPPPGHVPWTAPVRRFMSTPRQPPSEHLLSTSRQPPPDQFLSTSRQPPPEQFPSTFSQPPPEQFPSTFRQPPPEQFPSQQPSTFSPKKSVEDVLIQNRGESRAGKAAVHLAQFVFLGADLMRQSTAATLDEIKMRHIKEIILAKYGVKRCLQDKNAL